MERRNGCLILIPFAGYQSSFVLKLLSKLSATTDFRGDGTIQLNATIFLPLFTESNSKQAPCRD